MSLLGTLVCKEPPPPPALELLLDFCVSWYGCISLSQNLFNFMSFINLRLFQSFLSNTRSVSSVSSGLPYACCSVDVAWTFQSRPSIGFRILSALSRGSICSLCLYCLCFKIRSLCSQGALSSWAQEVLQSEPPEHLTAQAPSARLTHSHLGAYWLSCLRSRAVESWWWSLHSSDHSLVFQNFFSFLK